VVAGAPLQELVPPSRLDDPAFPNPIIQQALFGPEPVFDLEQGTKKRLERGQLRLEQDGAAIVLAEDGTVVVSVPAILRDRESRFGLSALIEEDIRSALTAALGFIGWLLDEVDLPRRLSQIIVLAAIEGGINAWMAHSSRTRCKPGTGDAVDAPT